MGRVAEVILAVWVLLLVYAYVGYPIVLWLLHISRPGRETAPQGGDLPPVTIVIPALNEEQAIGNTLSDVLETRQQILDQTPVSAVVPA